MGCSNYSGYSFNYNIKSESFGYAKPKANIRYKLLWIILFPFHIIEWVMFHEIKEKDARNVLWDEHTWLDRLLDWHDGFYDFDVVMDKDKN